MDRQKYASEAQAQNAIREIWQNSSYAICGQECTSDRYYGSTDRNICRRIHSSDNVLHNLYTTRKTNTQHITVKQQYDILLMMTPKVNAIQDNYDLAESKPCTNPNKTWHI